MRVHAGERNLCAVRNVPIDRAGPTVADVMIPPETVTTAAQARAVFESPRRHLVLVADADGTYLGAATREDLAGDELRPRRGPELTPTDAIGRAAEVVRATGQDRVPVVEGDRLVGLLCFNLRRNVYCTV